MVTFLELLMAGKVSEEDIDEFVEVWHESSTTKSLIEFLGFTKEEYEKWMLDSSYLKVIIERRKG